MKNLNTIRDEIYDLLKACNGILMRGHVRSTHYLIDIGARPSSAIANDLKCLKDFWDQYTDELDDPKEFDTPFSDRMNEVSEMLDQLKILITQIFPQAINASTGHGFTV
jgi:hypothetical protein